MQTLKDIAESFLLYAVCADCERMESVPIPELIEQLGGATEVTSIRRRLRCRECGARTGDIRIVYVGPHDRRAIFQYRR